MYQYKINVQSIYHVVNVVFVRIIIAKLTERFKSRTKSKVICLDFNKMVPMPLDEICTTPDDFLYQLVLCLS